MGWARALLRAIGQVTDRAFLLVLLRCAAWAAVCFAGLAMLVGWALHRLLRHRMLGDALATLGGTLSLLTALWFFLPVVAALATLLNEPICRAVERRWYPDLSPPRGAALLSQLGEATGFASRLLALSLGGLVLTLAVPGIGFPVAVALNGWAIGRGLFASVAMRRMTRAQALALYRSSRASVWPDGVVLALASNIPLVNLLVPVVGTAAMVHLVERARSSVRHDLEVA